ncbi:MAG: alkaline phosphatase family protein [Acidobacteria bacterium]|nr:alkaline phosphatase family protein [Acidobacteriota bacterium]
MQFSKPQRQFSALLGLILLLASFDGGGTAAQQRRGAAKLTAAKPVKLVVGIVIDQFRYDYLQRFADQFSAGGFRRLLNGGAVFTNANYPQTPTYTACGHAMFMTGSVPATNGIIGNEWYDRASGKTITSVSDDKAQFKSLGGKPGARAAAPHKLLGSTLGDELRLATAGQAKVVGISFKDRSAILPAGKRPNGAYWFDADTGTLTSSTYYFNDLPDWVKQFNQAQRPDKYFGAKWEKLLPEAAYQRSAPDDAAYEKKARYGSTFPYIINGGEEKPGPKFYTQFEITPYANEYLANFAKAAIENEGLGADDTTDLLTISFSANDLLGHLYGPYSQEVQDLTLRTDRTLADLFAYLDKKIGLDNVLIALTADHGVAPIPEQVQEIGHGGRISAKAVTDAVQNALAQRFGEDKWVLNFGNGNVYLDETVIERRKLDAAEVERAAQTAVLAVPGIAECLTRSQLLKGQVPQTMIARSVANGFFPPRNGNLVVVPQPFNFFAEGRDGLIITTHGTPYSYDTHVPMIFYGAGVTPGYYHHASSPADIAPTLAALLKVQPPSNNIGRVLEEALKTAAK